MRTKQELITWAHENREELDARRMACEDEGVQEFNRMAPEMSRRLWDSGAWLASVLREAGASDQEVTDAQFAAGQRSFAADAFEVAVAFANEYEQSGSLAEEPGVELADKIIEEMEQSDDG